MLKPVGFGCETCDILCHWHRCDVATNHGLDFAICRAHDEAPTQMGAAASCPVCKRSLIATYAGCALIHNRPIRRASTTTHLLFLRLLLVSLVCSLNLPICGQQPLVWLSQQ
jgi:hypothetical protein